MINKISSYESYSEGFDSIVSEIRRARRLRHSVSFAFTLTFQKAPGFLTTSGTVTFKDVEAGQVGLFRDRGIRLSLLEEKVQEKGGLLPALRYYVERRTGYEPKTPILRVEAHMFKTP